MTDSTEEMDKRSFASGIKGLRVVASTVRPPAPGVILTFLANRDFLCDLPNRPVSANRESANRPLANCYPPN